MKDKFINIKFIGSFFDLFNINILFIISLTSFVRTYTLKETDFCKILLNDYIKKLHFENATSFFLRKLWRINLSKTSIHIFFFSNCNDVALKISFYFEGVLHSNILLHPQQICCQIINKVTISCIYIC